MPRATRLLAQATHELVQLVETTLASVSAPPEVAHVNEREGVAVEALGILPEEAPAFGQQLLEGKR